MKPIKDSHNRFSKIIAHFLYQYPKKRLILISLLVLSIISIVPLILIDKKMESSLGLTVIKLKELTNLSQEYSLLKAKISTVESKATHHQNVSITNFINDVTASIGIKDKMKFIKDISSRQLKENISEETAEIFFEKLTLNELINLLYKIDSSSVAVTVKKAIIKKSFEKPNYLDITINLSLFKIKKDINK
ncbi:MAG: hypothetical protein N3A59_03450 [Thermodesulfovibrionales bacterium]|nr:hypothetical protein [Thermodesulfovibrionales bacterium]